jgi:hypothetical protein
MIDNKIIISDTNHWRELNYQDAKLYLALLDIDGKDDWRFPTDEESDEYEIYDKMSEYANHMSSVWTLEDLQSYPDLHLYEYWCIPVRDI